MVLIDPLYVTVIQYDGRSGAPPVPLPLKCGFRPDVVYRVIAGLDYSETSEMYFVLANEDGEIWSISTRHLRVLNARIEKGKQVL